MGLGVDGVPALKAFCRVGRQLDPEGLRNGVRELLLDGQDIGLVTVEAAAPQLVVVVHIDQLGAHRELGAALDQTTHQ